MPPTVCETGLTPNVPNAGGTPQAEPFQTVPDGQTQLLPFHTVPPEQALTQLEPIQVVPATHPAVVEVVVDLEPKEFELIRVQVIVPGLEGVTSCDPLLPWDPE